MAGHIGSRSGSCKGAYKSVGSAAIKAARPHLMLVYDRNAREHDAVQRIAAIPNGRPRGHHLPQSPATQMHARGMSDVSVAPHTRLFVRLILVTAIVLCCSMAFECLRSAKINQVLNAAPVEEVKAVTGDTLWSIAEQYGGNEVPTEDVVTWIRSRNGLSSAMLTPGQLICVPVVAY